VLKARRGGGASLVRNERELFSIGVNDSERWARSTQAGEGERALVELYYNIILGDLVRKL
jgi:hypothetical protein